MIAAQFSTFQQQFDAWMFGVGVVVLLVIIFSLCGLFGSEWWLARQKNRHELKKIKLHIKATREGMDPDYLKIIEKKAFDER